MLFECWRTAHKRVNRESKVMYLLKIYRVSKVWINSSTNLETIRVRELVKSKKNCSWSFRWPLQDFHDFILVFLFKKCGWLNISVSEIPMPLHIIWDTLYYLHSQQLTSRLWRCATKTATQQVNTYKFTRKYRQEHNVSFMFWTPYGWRKHRQRNMVSLT